MTMQHITSHNVTLHPYTLTRTCTSAGHHRSTSYRLSGEERPAPEVPGEEEGL